MKRAEIVLSLLASLSSAGCCMCAGPYDYCAPTFTGQRGECGDDCRPHARLGSAFSYSSYSPPATAYADDGDLPEVYDSSPAEPVQSPPGMHQQAPLPAPDGSESSYDARRRTRRSW